MVVLCRFTLLEKKNWQLRQICLQPATLSRHFINPERRDGGDCEEQGGEPQNVSKHFFGVNERAGVPQLLKLGQRNLQLHWKPSLRPHVPGVHMCKEKKKTNSTHKQSCCWAELGLFTAIKQTNKKTLFAAWTRFCFCKEDQCGVSFQLQGLHSMSSTEQDLSSTVAPINFHDFT